MMDKVPNSRDSAADKSKTWATPVQFSYRVA